MTLERSLTPEFREFMPLFGALDGPILDAPCGYGRHALSLQEIGCRVACVDIDDKALEHLACLNEIPAADGRKELELFRVDVVNDDWPFEKGQFSGALNIHFHGAKLLSNIAYSLDPGGLVYIETVTNRKGNFIQLPQAGEIQRIFGDDFDYLYIKERRAGPIDSGKVTVRMLAQKK
ncbi:MULTISPECIES: class I SAM-dependent methyltransferase [Mycobacterium avium complex (MAC)]|uniref:class I SAM-dependent methyltransferase n=1 Tax=Mycobacterium avium complex (MAC) TaxID=120793 RepID=UPI0013015CD9|nr:class I SAM-dependent methyltransferase [Mycobacterium paraintracellulare]